MDFAALAHESVTLLAPALQYLMVIGEKLSEGAAKEIGADVWKQAKSLWGGLGPEVTTSPAAEEALSDLAKTPGDPRLQTVAEVQIEKLFKQNQDLAAEVDHFFKELRASGVTIAAMGERSVAAQTISRSTITTGDTTTGEKTGAQR
jgi:hypothetical protein